MYLFFLPSFFLLEKKKLFVSAYAWVTDIIFLFVWNSSKRSSFWRKGTKKLFHSYSHRVPKSFTQCTYYKFQSARKVYCPYLNPKVARKYSVFLLFLILWKQLKKTVGKLRVRKSTRKKLFTTQLLHESREASTKKLFFPNIQKVLLSPFDSIHLNCHNFARFIRHFGAALLQGYNYGGGSVLCSSRDRGPPKGERKPHGSHHSFHDRRHKRKIYIMNQSCHTNHQVKIYEHDEKETTCVHFI